MITGETWAVYATTAANGTVQCGFHELRITKMLLAKQSQGLFLTTEDANIIN